MVKLLLFAEPDGAHTDRVRCAPVRCALIACHYVSVVCAAHNARLPFWTHRVPSDIHIPAHVVRRSPRPLNFSGRRLRLRFAFHFEFLLICNLHWSWASDQSEKPKRVFIERRHEKTKTNEIHAITGPSRIQVKSETRGDLLSCEWE